jgi:hypothetical protein
MLLPNVPSVVVPVADAIDQPQHATTAIDRAEEAEKQLASEREKVKLLTEVLAGRAA